MAAEKQLELARKHFAKVQAARKATPIDWSDLTVYGLYALEAAVLAAALSLGLPVKRTHWDKRDIAQRLHGSHRLPDVSTLLDQLNEARKAVAYGDVAFPSSLDAASVARAIESYISACETLLRGDQP
jgi:hypothetical protein